VFRFQLPSTMPYAIMFDEDCGGDEELCSRLRDPLAETTESLAQVGEGGRFVWVEGAGHDIDLTQPQAVRDTLTRSGRKQPPRTAITSESQIAAALMGQRSNP
jgi:hypothetical protein